MTDDIIHIKEGTTAVIPMQLMANGVGINLSSITYVRLTMMDSLRGTYHYNSTDVSPAVVIDIATTGNISFHPPDTTIFRTNKSPYQVVVWIYQANGTRYACPMQGANIIIVEPEF